MFLNLRVRSASFISPEHWPVFVRNSLISLVIIISAAYFSRGWYGMDEYFQVIEFVAYKQGKTPAADLPWEFPARARQWIQPFGCYVIASCLSALNIRDSFVQLFFFKLFAGLTGWIAINLLALAGYAWIPGNGRYRLLWLYVVFFIWYIPFLFARTSQENLSTTLFTISFALVLLRIRTGKESIRVAHGAVFDWLCGVVMGLAFEVRFQTAVMAASFVAWTAVTRSLRPRSIVRLCFGFAAAVAAGVLIDRWGYGSWMLMPWRYFEKQILEGVAGSMGTMPWYGYFQLLTTSAMAVVLVPLSVLVVAGWARNRMSPAVWATLPFFVIHCFLSHKRIRYLLPLSLICLMSAMAGLAWSRAAIARAAGFLRAKAEKSIAAVLVAVNTVTLIAVVFYTDPVTPMQAYIHKNFPRSLVLHTMNYDPFIERGLKMSFHRPKHYKVHTVDSYDALRTAMNRIDTVYYAAYHEGFPAEATDVAMRATLLYTSVSLRRRVRMALEYVMPAVVFDLFNISLNRRARVLYRIVGDA